MGLHTANVESYHHGMGTPTDWMLTPSHSGDDMGTPSHSASLRNIRSGYKNILLADISPGCSAELALEAPCHPESLPRKDFRYPSP